MSLPEPDDPDDVLLVTTGLSRDDRDQVTEWITALGWAQVNDYTCQGAYYKCSVLYCTTGDSRCVSMSIVCTTGDSRCVSMSIVYTTGDSRFVSMSIRYTTGDGRCVSMSIVYTTGDSRCVSMSILV